MIETDTQLKKLIVWYVIKKISITLCSTAGCAFSSSQLAHGDWKFWWATGMHFNGRLPDDWKQN